ncbi:MAG: acyl carrier protein [Flavobacteriaceae bacterium]
MENSPRYDDLLKIIQPYLPEDITPNQVGPKSHFVEELNINSAHLVDIVLDVEDKYDIVLENEDMDQMQTVDQAIELIQKKLAAK